MHGYVSHSVGSNSLTLMNADNQPESEDDDTDAGSTMLYDVDESDAIDPPTAAADAGECYDVCLVEPCFFLLTSRATHAHQRFCTACANEVYNQ